MPSTAATTTLSANSVDILNAIRNSATAQYKDYVPVARDASDVKDVGAIIMDYPALQNEFLNALVNRIGRVLITSKEYSNPWKMFKKGMLEFGETVEEVFVELAKPYEYDPATSETTIFKREIPDVRAAFHILNYKKRYKQSIQRADLRQAFLSRDGLASLVTKIIGAMYSASEYDEFLTMKYMIARHIMQGELYPVTVTTPVTYNAADTVKAIKKVSNDFTFISPDYNRAGVRTFTPKENQYIIINSEFDAVMDVDVLAAAFHMEKAEFMGHRVLVDSFGTLDTDRLDELFGANSWYTPIDADTLEALAAIPAVIVDKDWFMILDNMLEMQEDKNGEGLTWHYNYHTWKTFSVSPFANGAMFIPGEPSVDSITITPATATLTAGASILLDVEVATTNFAPKTVTWESSDESIAVVDIYGNVHTADGASGSVSITATSTYDESVTASATITVS